MTDPLMDHLEMMSGMLDRHHNQPAAYFDAYELKPEDVVLDRLHLEHAAMDAGTQGNAEPCSTVATVPSEPSVLAYELEPEAIVMDRMQAELQASWEALRHTNAGEVAR